MPDIIKEEYRTETIAGRKRRYKWYTAQAYIGKSKDGKKKYKRFSGRNKNEIIRQITEARESLNIEVSKSRTLGEALEEYIQSRSATCSVSTIRGYRMIQKNALLELQDKEISTITQTELQAAFNEYAKDHSPKTCRNVHGLFSAVIQGNRPGFIVKTTLPQKERNEIYVPDEDEINDIAKLIRGSNIEIPFLLATQCGLRESEITALTVDNIYDDYIRITEALVMDENGEYQKKVPKSYAGYRDIPISREFADMLRKSALPDGRVTHLRSINICNSWIRFRDKHGIDEHMNFHALRHHYASKCLLIGMPQRYIAEIMGHSSTKMIEQVYQHVFGSAMDKYAKKIRKRMNEFCRIYNTKDNTNLSNTDKQYKE